jgi:hypothetical protein
MEPKLRYFVHKSPQMGYFVIQINPVPKEINYLEDLGVDGKIILERIFRT